MGNDESRFNVSLIVKDKVTRPQDHKTTNHNLFEERGEPKRYRTEALLLTSLTPYRWAKPVMSSVSFITAKIVYASIMIKPKQFESSLTYLL